MNSKEQKYFDVMTLILDTCSGIEFTPIKFQEFSSKHKVDYYIFKGMKHLSLIDMQKKPGKNFVRSRILSKELEPRHAVLVLEAIQKIKKNMKKEKDQRTDILTPLEEQLQSLKAELVDRIKYPGLSKASLEAVKILQEEGFTVLIEKPLKLEFVAK